jgi:hypothetical protein
VAAATDLRPNRAGYSPQCPIQTAGFPAAALPQLRPHGDGVSAPGSAWQRLHETIRGRGRLDGAEDRPHKDLPSLSAIP